MKRIGIASILFLSACGSPSPEISWVSKQESRCHAMGGRLNWDRDTHTAECWRSAFMRPDPHKLFAEKFQESAAR